jgi:AcrR family transcriptional regulator
MRNDSKSRDGRKQPKQARAQATVETILDGAIQVFDREGPENATTSRIAEVAGVSVGTLYQYFTNREAIVDALQEREFTRADAMLKGLLTSTSFSSERELSRAIIAGLLGLYRAAPALHRVLAIDGLRIGPTERVQDFDRRMIEALRGFFDITTFRIRRKNHHAAAFVLYHSVRATLLASIFEGSLVMQDEVVVEEVTDLVVAHLVG